MAKKKKPKEPRPSNEEIRWKILRLLYDEHSESWGRQRFIWTELRKKVREGLRFNPNETTRNLDYLIKNEWIVKEREPYAGPRSQAFGKERELYSISANAMDLFEGDSTFSVGPSIQGLAIIGDDNIVQTGRNILVQSRYQDLQESLSALLQRAILSDDLSQDQKIQLAADIRAIQAQLVKPEQDETLLNRLKSKISWLGNIASFSSFFMKVAEYWPF